MKNFIKKTIIATVILTISIFANTCLVSWQGLLWHWPEVNWWWGWGLFWNWQWWMSLWNNQTIYNTEITSIVNTEYEWTTIDHNPIEIWISRITRWNNWNGLVGVDTDNPITDYNIALNKILQIIQNIINYILGLLSVVAIIYLLIHGYIVLTAGGDDSKVKKWLKWIKNAFIAIAWIALSWIIISFILRVINTFSS